MGTTTNEVIALKATIANICLPEKGIGGSPDGVAGSRAGTMREYSRNGFRQGWKNKRRAFSLARAYVVSVCRTPNL
jgi:hypothetical protein